MNKNSVLFKIFDVIFFICFTVILLFAIFGYNRFNYNSHKIILVFFSILISLCLVIAYKYIIRNKFKYVKLIKLMIFIIILILQIVVGIFLRVNEAWDYGVILKSAYNLEYTFPLNDYIEYFSMYPNNIPTVLLLRIVFLISNFIGINNISFISVAFNIIMIDIGIYFFQKLVEKFIGENESIFALMFLGLMCPIYLYVPILYTDTLSFMFPQLILLLYFTANKEKSINKRLIIYAVLIGISTFIGMIIKITILFTLIAIIIYEIFRKKINKENIKKKLIVFCIIVITIIILLLLKKVIYSKFITPRLDANKEFPVTHWIMMGLTGEGQYNAKDVEFTSGFNTYEEKKDATKGLIKERLKGHIVNKDVGFFIKKIVFVWGDGNYYSANKLSRKPVNRSVVQEYIVEGGSRQEIFVYITQSIQFCLLFFIIVSCIASLKKENALNTISRIIMFGLLIFFIFWEARSRYLMNYIAVFLVASLYGIEYISKFRFNRKNIKKVFLLKRGEK